MAGGLRERFGALLARNSFQARSRRRVMQALAQKLTFVYFGAVDQHTDDHRIVRGFSASTTHQDNNYMVGAYDDYNVTFVDRTDLIELEHGTVEPHQWLIAEIDLLGKEDIPHFFMIPHHHGKTHYSKVFSALRGLEPVELPEATPEFANRYAVYSIAEKAVEIEQLLPSVTLQTIAAHFWPLAVEVFEGSVYLYFAEKKVTEHDLNTMIKNGAWLAQTLDKPISL